MGVKKGGARVFEREGVEERRGEEGALEPGEENDGGSYKSGECRRNIPSCHPMRPDMTKLPPNGNPEAIIRETGKGESSFIRGRSLVGLTESRLVANLFPPTRRRLGLFLVNPSNDSSKNNRLFTYYLTKLLQGGTNVHLEHHRNI